MSIEKIIPAGGASPRGHYTPALRAEFQTRLTLSNIKRILEAAGAAITDVVKCSVFLRDIAEFSKMNRAYAEFFGDHKPARTTVEAKFHQAEMLVEIDCVAYKPRR
jgi:2-iminobutanoate/2-iminopropanoate deaminase